MNDQQRPIRVAISGGGLAGAALARALLAHSNLYVEIFESAPQFSERGAAVGIGRNGLRALSLMGPAPHGLRKCIDKAGGVENKGNLFFVGSGPAAGTNIMEFGPKGSGDKLEIIVHRAQLLSELLKEIPSGHMFVNKKLASVTEEPEKLVLNFADGTTKETDVVIGADGIHGVTRGLVLGKDHPATAPIFSGFWDARNLLSYEDAVGIIGSKYINQGDSRQHDWMGPDAFFIHDIIEGGKMVGIAVAGNTDEEWPPNEWKRPLSRAKLESMFDGWVNGPQIVEAMMKQETPTMFSEWVHRDAPTYVRNRIAIMGDAAHAMVPFQAAGATQALEDAMILSAVLGAARSKADVPAALKAYDTIRRPRSQAIVASAYKTALIVMGKDSAVGLDPIKLKEALEHRWDFIMEIDLEDHRAKALQAMEKELASQ